jgi:hypothetical protein
MRRRFHGDPERFEVVASFIADRFGRSIKYIADVAGGQGMLARVLTKKYGYEASVVDPRGWALRGVEAEPSEFTPDDASYYDLIVGLHPDEATRAVAEAALVKPVLLVPCCNFWDRSRKLGRDALVETIGSFYSSQSIGFDVVSLDFKGPMNLALVSSPPA